MRTLKEVINYTIEKKEYQLTKLETHYTQSIQNIEEYIKGKTHVTIVGTSLGFLSNKYYWNFISNFLVKDSLDNKYIIQSTLLGIESNNWEFFLGKKVERYNSSILFHEAIKHMAQSLLLGWDKLAIQYGKLLIKMLYGKQYKGGHPAYKHPWFMLEIFCKWQNIKLDYDKLHYPEDMDIYKSVLDNWDTLDEHLLAKLVDRMVEFHIAQSDEYVTTDEYGNEASSDFSSSDYFIYAVEILLWLNIRGRMQLLPDYTPGNDLMKLAINNWHTQPTEIPKIELIEKAKEKLLKDYPGIEFEI